MANGTPWTKAEEAFVRRNINKLTIKQMAETLDRPYGGVAWKRSQIMQEPKKKPVRTTTNVRVAPTLAGPKKKTFGQKVREFFS